MVPGVPAQVAEGEGRAVAHFHVEVLVLHGVGRPEAQLHSLQLLGLEAFQQPAILPDVVKEPVDEGAELLVALHQDHPIAAVIGISHLEDGKGKLSIVVCVHDQINKYLVTGGEYAGIHVPAGNGVQNCLVVGKLHQRGLGILDAGVSRLTRALDHANAGAAKLRLVFRYGTGLGLRAQIDRVHFLASDVVAVGHLVQGFPFVVEQKGSGGHVHLPGGCRPQCLFHGVIFHEHGLHTQLFGDLAGNLRHGAAPGACQVPVLLRVIGDEIVDRRLRVRRDGQHAPGLDGAGGVIRGRALSRERALFRQGRGPQEHGQRQRHRQQFLEHLLFHHFQFLHLYGN